MWYCGYEGSDMREAFRVSTGMMDIGCWPSSEFEQSWRSLAFFLRGVCDRCLSLALDRQIHPPSDHSDDKSVSYAVFYPNNRGGQQEPGINIKVDDPPCGLDGQYHPEPNSRPQEHVDPSLFVIEPIADVAGLEVPISTKNRIRTCAETDIYIDLFTHKKRRPNTDRDPRRPSGARPGVGRVGRGGGAVLGGPGGRRLRRPRPRGPDRRPHPRRRAPRRAGADAARWRGRPGQGSRGRVAGQGSC